MVSVSTDGHKCISFNNYHFMRSFLAVAIDSCWKPDPLAADVSRLGIQAKLPSFRHPKVKSGLKTKSFHRWLNTTDGSHAKHGHSKIRSLNPSVLMATAWPKKHEKTVGIAAGCSQVSASTLIPVPTWGSEGSWLISNNVCKTIGSTIPKFTMFMSCINHQSTWVVYDATSLTSWSPGAPPNATGDINHLRI